MILSELFFSFLQIGLFSIGGGYAAIPLIQNQTVELHGWLTQAQFMDLATIAEMTPGPIAINGATFVGLAATFGCIFPSLILVSLLAWVYRKYRELPVLQGMLACLRPAVVALISAAGINMLLQIVFGSRDAVSFDRISWAGLALSASAFMILRRFRWNPIVVMLLCGAVGLVLGLFGVL